MANVARNIGLSINGPLLRANTYAVASNYATAVYKGDPVIATGTSNQINVITAGTGNKVLGAVLACFDSDGLPLAYIPASTGGYVLVADDPNQEYLAQDDNHASGSAFGLSACGANVNLVSGTGSTITGTSGWKLNSQNTPGTTAGDQIRLKIPAKFVSGVNDYTAKAALWIVRLNNPQAAAGIVGAGV